MNVTFEPIKLETPGSKHFEALDLPYFFSRRVVLDVNLAPPLTWRPVRPPLLPTPKPTPGYISNEIVTK